jgi:hypothetical protein
VPKESSLRFPILLALAFATGCGGPLVMLPGGALSGPVEPIPRSWAFTDAYETVQLETRPADPYSVNVWGVAIGEHFYVAGSAGNKWASHVAEDPAVRLRIDGIVYALEATPTDREEDLAAFLAAIEKKYDWEPDAEQRERAILYRLSPRKE